MHDADVRTWIFTWSPQADDDNRYGQILDGVSQGRLVHEPWTTGRRTSGLEQGDVVYLLQQGRRRRQADQRGLVARGWLTGSGVYRSRHWREPDRLANWTSVVWDSALRIEAPLPLQRLQQQVPEVDWTPFGSGVAVPEEAETRLHALWDRYYPERANHVPLKAPAQWLQVKDLLSEFIGANASWSISGGLEADVAAIVRIAFPPQESDERSQETIRRIRRAFLQLQRQGPASSDGPIAVVSVTGPSAR